MLVLQMGEHDQRFEQFRQMREEHRRAVRTGQILCRYCRQRIQRWESYASSPSGAWHPECRRLAQGMPAIEDHETQVRPDLAALMAEWQELWGDF